jgi:AraC-like DNA-binding protein
MGPCGSEESVAAHQLVFTRTGMFVKHMGRRRVVGEPTHVLFLNPDETYRVSHPAPGGDNCTVLSVQPSLVADVVSQYDAAAAERNEVRFAVSHAPLEPRVILAHHALRRASRYAGTDAMLIEETAIDLLSATIAGAYRARGISRGSRRAGTIESRRDLAEATKVMLCGDPTVNHSLSALARNLNSSPFHLARIFSAEVGFPIHQYLLRLRLVLALEKLSDDYANLSALALDLGFASHSHFSTLFRRIFGTSPSGFRRAVNSPDIDELRKNLKVSA